jgi:Type VI secretion system/phage-baseplate injector OB domain
MDLFELKEYLSEFGLEWLNRYYGVYSGTIYSNADPDNLGRLQLSIPAVYGDKPFKYWAFPRGVIAAKGVGFYFVPNEGEKVRVSFENGDPRFPLWEYGWWAEGEAPDGATPEKKIIRTTAGHTIVFNDKEGEEAITITDKAGNKYTLDKEGCSTESKNISLGKYKTSDEKAVLGDTAQKKLEDILDKMDAICDAVKLVTVPTALGPSGTPLNFVQFDGIKTQIAALKGSLPSILSNTVTLNK